MKKEKIKCKICGKEFKSYVGLQSHVAQSHGLKSKEYYDKYLKKPSEGICPICGKETAYQNIFKGYLKYCSCKCSANSTEVRDNCKKTCLKKYGVDNVWKANSIKDTIKETCLDRYGVEYYSQTKESKEKIKKTCLKRYGVENAFQSKELMSKINKDELYKKAFDTKRKNGTFNTSKLEEDFYKQLLSHFNKDDIERQYKEKRYSFNCDFYIKSLDLFIEINGTWTHNDHWFNENNKDDLNILKTWEKGNTDYYKNAIYTWTILDVSKRKIARENNLNYVVLWDKKDIEEWFKLDCPIGRDWKIRTDRS